MTPIKVEMKVGDVLAEPSDVLVLKYAQEFHGVDEVVAGALRAVGRAVAFPKPGDAHIEQPVPGISAGQILFMGVPPLQSFSYPQIRAFAMQAIASAAKQIPEAKVITATVHGAYGLDEIEAFKAEVAGFVDAIRAGTYPRSLERIMIVERYPGRVARLTSTLHTLLPEGGITTTEGSPHTEAGRLSEQLLKLAGAATEVQPHAFIAMPFMPQMDDVYHYGIQSAVKASGLVCERADHTAFHGDVMERVKFRIRGAALVVADLTDANPNVYLELGYAWGVGVPTVLIVQSTAHLKFDTRGQRCLPYKQIRELEELLTAELKALRSQN